MRKNFYQNAESTSDFLSAPPSQDNDDRWQVRKDHTHPLRSARVIDIEKIQPDPDQPRKTFDPDSLESLAESIRELDGIIDPITVEHVAKEGFYRIISGERRYRAAKMVGLQRLPCIVKEIDDHNRFLVQFVANLQREDLDALEEAAGIRHLVETYGYNQSKIAKLLNKSKGHISQILGLERLGEEARDIIHNASISKEAQIQASREADPARQRDILMEASKKGGTVRNLRKKRKTTKRNPKKVEPQNEPADEGTTGFFQKWKWKSPDNRFSIDIQFSQNQPAGQKNDICIKALKAAIAGLSENAVSPPLSSMPPTPSKTE